MTKSDRSKLHVTREDREYHEELGLIMTSVHFARHKRKKEYHYGDVSYLKLAHEGKIPKPTDEATLRDLDVYLEAAARHQRLTTQGGEA